MKHKRIFNLFILTTIFLMAIISLSGCLSDNEFVINQYNGSDRIEDDKGNSNSAPPSPEIEEPSPSETPAILVEEPVSGGTPAILVEEPVSGGTPAILVEEPVSGGTPAIPVASDMVGIWVDHIEGSRQTIDINNLEYINIRLSLRSGSAPLDLNQLTVYFNNREAKYALDSTSLTSSTFHAVAIRDIDSSFTTSNPVMNKEDLVQIILKPGINIPPRSLISINLVPYGGANTQVDMVIPSSYGSRTTVNIYP